MLYLIAIVLLNVLLFSIFKMFPKYGISPLQAIAVNYWVCVLTGTMVLSKGIEPIISFNYSWIYWALLLGSMLIALFNLIAYSTKVEGMTTTTIANKLSLVIPVLFAAWLYQEHFGVGKIAGILIAFPAVYLTVKKKQEVAGEVKNLFWPVLLFIGSGILDTLMKYVQTYYLATTADQAIFTIQSFAVAAMLGTAVLVVRIILRKEQLHWKSIVAGVVLGIPNYFSIYYLIRLFHVDFMESSAVIPVNNVSILLCTTLVAFLFFKEQITRLRLVGIILSIISILLIAISDLNGGYL